MGTCDRIRDQGGCFGKCKWDRITHTCDPVTCDGIGQQGGCFGKCTWDKSTHTCGPPGRQLLLAIGDKVQESGLAQIEKKTEQPPWSELAGTAGVACTPGRQFCEVNGGGKKCEVPCPASKICPAPPQCTKGQFGRWGQKEKDVVPCPVPTGKSSGMC